MASTLTACCGGSNCLRGVYSVERGALLERKAWSVSDVVCIVAMCCCKSDLLQLRASAKFLAMGTVKHVVLELIQSEDSRIAMSSMQILPNIVQKGDPAAVSAVISRLSDCEILIRKHALELLEEICLSGDTHASIGFASLVADTDTNVRNSAVTALVRTATKGDKAVLEAITALLEHEDIAVRCAALDMIGDLALKCDSDIVALVSAQLEANHTAQRCCAICALGKIASTGGTLDSIVQRLCHRDPGVRLAAAVALSKAISRGNHPAAVTALLGCLEDRDERLREAVVVALGKMAALDDPFVTDALAACIDNDSSPRVQRRSLLALGEICSSRNPAIIPIASKCLDHCYDFSVRRNALVVLGEVYRELDACPGQATENRDIALALVDKYSKDDVLAVRSAAAVAAVNLRGDAADQSRVECVRSSGTPIVPSVSAKVEKLYPCHPLDVISRIRTSRTS